MHFTGPLDKTTNLNQQQLTELGEGLKHCNLGISWHRLPFCVYFVHTYLCIYIYIYLYIHTYIYIIYICMCVRVTCLCECTLTHSHVRVPLKDIKNMKYILYNSKSIYIYNCNKAIFITLPKFALSNPDTVAKRTPRCISWSSIQDLRQAGGQLAQQ